MRRISVLAIALLSFSSFAATTAPAQLGSNGLRGDFNGDGFADLAIGVPGEDFEQGEMVEEDAGAVNIIYGSEVGLTADDNQLFTQEGLAGETPETSDAFGSSLVPGDFNGDGFSDLAVGVPGEDLQIPSGVILARAGGVVHVLYGSASGLTTDGTQLWMQGSGGVGDEPEDFDEFGSSLAAGDVNGDGHDDLAIAAFNEDLGSLEDAGIVHILHGSPDGLTADDSQIWTQDSPGIKEDAGANELFGFSLAIANFGKTTHDDLAVGVPGEFQEQGFAGLGAGAVNVLYGSNEGLTSTGNQLWTQDSRKVPDKVEVAETFGWDLAAADFGKSSHADLAIGVLRENLGSRAGAGAVTVIYGSAKGLRGKGSQMFTRDNMGTGRAESNASFGFSVEAGDVGKSSFADLVAGQITDEIDGEPRAGSIHIAYGSATGLKTKGSRTFTAATPGVPLDPFMHDFFGFDISYLDGPVVGVRAFAVGVPFADGVTGIDTGAVVVFYGGPKGLKGANTELWTQDSEGILDDPEATDYFGGGLDGIGFTP